MGWRVSRKIKAQRPENWNLLQGKSILAWKRYLIKGLLVSVDKSR